MDATISIHVNVTDKQALWEAAAANAVATQSHPTREAYKAEFGVEQVSTHLRLIIDRQLPEGLGDLGFDVLDSTCEVDTIETPPNHTEMAGIALETAYKELASHPENASRDQALDTIASARSILRFALQELPDNANGGVIYHLRDIYRDLNTDVDGISREDANTLIRNLAEWLVPIVQAASQPVSLPPAEYEHLGPKPFVPEGQQLFVAKQERDAIAHFEAYVVADSKRDAARVADNDACVWVENGTGELDDRNIEIETLDNLSP
jgi:hypothetical protein